LSWRVVLIGVASVILILGTLFVLSEMRRDAAECMWPGRPGCQPVGTTMRLVEPYGEDGLCTRTRYYDEEGEAGFTEIGCP
jgi:hypothetical protein